MGWETVLALAASTLETEEHSTFGLHPQDGPHVDVRIRVEDDKVVYTLMMNLAFLDFVAPFNREMPDNLASIEEPQFREAMIGFFANQTHITVDGKKLIPTIRDYEFLRPGDEYLPLFPNSGMRGLLKGRLVLDYFVDAPPEHILFQWDTYPPDLISGEVNADGSPPKLAIAANMQAEGIITILDFSEQIPTAEWRRSGETFADRMMPVPPVIATPKTSEVSVQDSAAPTATRIPLATIGILVLLAGLVVVTRCNANWPQNSTRLWIASPVLLIAAVLTWNVGSIQIGSAGATSDPPTALVDSDSNDKPLLPTPEDTSAIFEPLLANIYTAFDYTDDDNIYDALALSVEGRTLDTLYNDIYRSLIQQDEGAAVSRVQSVTPLETETLNIRFDELERPFIKIRARWQVEGAVYHFGHSHTRLNEYTAEYSIVGTENGWRISGYDVIEQFRLDPDPNDVPFSLPPGQDI